MTKRRSITPSLVAFLLLSSLLPAAAQQRPAAAGARVGTIKALIPVAKVYRGTGRNVPGIDVKKNDDVLQNDLLRTERGGRARVEMLDGSILSLGSQAELRIVSANRASQQTALQLGYGRVRAEVASITRPDGRFDLKTPTAVAGVIGTDFGADSGIPGMTVFVCISGVVTLQSNDPAFPDQIPCPAGNTVTVQQGRRPGQPEPASPGQVQKLVEDTEPAEIGSMTPNVGLPGETIDAVVKGKNLNKITGVGFPANSGITAQIQGTPEAESLNLRVVVAGNAEPGPRTITFTTGDGKQIAVVFMVVTPQAGKRKLLPEPRIEGSDERGLDVGLQAVFDGAKSRGAERATIVNFKWELCDPAYKPQQLGVPYDPAENTACKPLPDYQATGAEFKFETCDLVPADYVVRLTVTDVEGRKGAADFRLRVLPETFPSPEEVLQGMKGAYEALQPNQFMDYFSTEKYYGYTQLSENIRRTFPTLSSMSINLRISQTQRRCNEATVRADWQQNFVLRDGACSQLPSQICSQEEQLTLRMERTPGKYWKVTDIQGDNGTVQGLPAGPNIDANTFDVEVAGITPAPSYVGSLSGVINVDIGNHGPNPSPFLGNALIIRDAGNAILGQASVPSVAPNQFATVPVFVPVIPNAPGSMTITASIEPHPLGDINAANESRTAPITILAPVVDLQVQNLVFGGGTPPFVETEFRNVTFQIHNAGNAPSAAGDTYACSLSGPSTFNIPASPAPAGVIAPGGSAFINLGFTIPAGSAGSYTLQCTAAANSLGTNQDPLEANATLADNTASTPVNLTAAVVDLQLQTLSLVGGTTIASNQFRTLQLTIHNAGNVGTNAGGALPTDTMSCSLVSVGTTPLGTFNIPFVGPGQTVVANFNFTVPGNQVGTGSINCTLSTDPFETVTTNNSNSIGVNVALNIDLQLNTFPTLPIAFQAGEAGNLNVSVTNIGGDDAPAGWDVVLLVNGSPIASAVGPLLPGGQSISIPLAFTIPTISTPPYDISPVPYSLRVNNNGAITEVALGNNNFTTNTRLVDFTLTSIALAAPMPGVNGRDFGRNNVVTVLPATYPLPLFVNMTGLPAGVNQSGAFGQNLSAFPLTTPPGSYTISPSATVNGVTKTGANIGFDVVTDTLAVPPAAPQLLPGQFGGPLSIISVAVSGGAYAMNASLTSVTGVSANILSAPSLPGPGNVVISLSADLTAVPGPHDLTLTLQDNGVPAFGIPGKTVQFLVPIVVQQFVDQRVSSFTYDVAPPFKSGEIHTITMPVTNQGNVPSANNTLTCVLSGTPGTFTAVSQPFGVINPTQTVTQTFPFTVPVNFSGANTMTCTIAQDPNEPNANFLDGTNTAVVSTLIQANVDLVISNVPAPPVAFQMGGGYTINTQVTNLGADTAPAGWNVQLDIGGGAQITSVLGPTLGGGASTNVAINFNAPNLAPAPVDLSFIPMIFQVNQNNAVSETNTANNIVNRLGRFVDFVVNPSLNPSTAVETRVFSAPAAFTVLPASYPLAGTLNVTGLPAGLTNSGGTFGTNITGTPNAGSAGSYPNIQAGMTVNGITHGTASPLDISVRPEIAMSLTTAFSLSSNGPAQTFSVQFSGGIAPLNTTLALPTGVTVASGPPLVNSVDTSAGPVVLSWQLQADGTAATGSGLTNITVTATDNGFTTAPQGLVTPPGNKVFAPAYALSATDNYTILSTGSLRPLPATGANALQVDEVVTFIANVKNVGNLGAAGTVQVDLTCAPACGTFTGTAAAPAAGATVPVFVTMNLAGATPGTYTPTFTIVASPPETTATDNSVTEANLEIFNFTLTDDGPVTGVRQNVGLSQTGQFGITLAEAGPPAPLSLTVNTTGSAAILLGGNPLPQSGPLPPSSPVLDLSAAGGTVTGTDASITIASTRFGVTRSITHDVRFYTAGIQNISSGQPGDSFSNPVPVAIGDTNGVFVDFKLQGDWSGGAAAFQGFPPISNVTQNLIGSPGLPNDTFTVQVTAQAGASLTVQPVNISFAIPNSHPQEFVQTQLWIQPVQASDLFISDVQPTVFRNYSTTPLLWGEMVTFDVTVANTGGGPSGSPVIVTAHMDGMFGPTVGAGVIASSIPNGNSDVATVILTAPDPITTGGNSIVFVAEQDTAGNEFNTTNNSSPFSITSSNWAIALVSPTGPGSSGLPATITGAGGSSLGINVNFVVQSGGSLAATVPVVQSAASTHVSLSPNAFSFNPGNVSGAVSLVCDGSCQDGLKTAQLLATMPSGSKRSVNLYGNVTSTGSGVPGLVTVTSNVGNAANGIDPGCTGGCTPLQVNGVLVETVQLTPVNDTYATGTTDLTFSDDPAIISNTDTAGNALAGPYLNAAAYGTAAPVNFTPLDNNGTVTTGPAKVVVQAYGQTHAAQRGFPITPVDTNNAANSTTLYFNIGDLDMLFNNGTCFDVLPGQNEDLTFDFVPTGGFNAPSIDWTLTNSSGFNIGLGATSGTVNFSAGDYPTLTINIANNEPSGPFAAVLTFSATINNANGSATKTFDVHVIISPFGCSFANSRTRVAESTLGTGGWVRNGRGGSAASRAGVRPPAGEDGPLPDLQIKPADVSFSPSMPQAGDTVSVRFKVSNVGSAAARGVPIALLINGKTVATDTFDVNANSSTLGGLEFSTATLARPLAGGGTRTALVREQRLQRGSSALGRGERSERVDALEGGPALRPVALGSVQLVIDPAGTVKQKSADFKSVALKGLQVLPSVEVALDGLRPTPDGGLGLQKVMVEVADACVGLRVASGATAMCENGDADLMVEDLGAARYALNSIGGVADLGAVSAAAADVGSARFESRVLLVAGHSYAVKLSGDRVGVFQLTQVLSPKQWEALMAQKFQRGGRRITGKLGGDTQAPETGDVSGSANPKAIVYFELVLRPAE
jgi:hypothetical protein